MTSPSEDNVENESASQTDWRIIANKIRECILEKAKDISKMKGDEILDFLRAVREALQLEISASHFDDQTNKWEV